MLKGNEQYRSAALGSGWRCVDLDRNALISYKHLVISTWCVESIPFQSIPNLCTLFSRVALSEYVHKNLSKTRVPPRCIQNLVATKEFFREYNMRMNHVTQQLMYIALTKNESLIHTS